MSDPQMIVLTPKRGRPSRAGTPATKRVEFCCTADERAALERVAAQNKQPLAAVIRDAVNSFVQDYGGAVTFLPSGDSFKKR